MRGHAANRAARLLPPVALVFGAAAPAAAQQAGSPGAEAERIEAEEIRQSPPAEDRWSVDIGGQLVTEYISRGILFAKEPSLQTYVTVNFALPELEGGAITDAKLFVGSWQNVKLGTVEPGDAGPFTRFYETDIYAGAAVQLNERWNLSATYYRYESLGDSFEGYNDLELIVGFDDSGLWGGDGLPRNFSLSPSLRMVQEAGRPGRDDALYVQPSLSPSFDMGDRDNPVRVTIPLVIGLSDEYFDGVDGGKETFGFFRTGGTLTITPFPEDVPTLTVNAGFDLWLLNENVASGLDDHRVVGRIGAGWSF